MRLARRPVRLAACALLVVASGALGAPAAAAARPGDPPVPTYQAVDGCVRSKAAPATVANGVGWAQRYKPGNW